MEAEYLWKSLIAGYITQFLDTMRLAGYKYERQERRLRQFDQYCFEHEVPESSLPGKSWKISAMVMNMNCCLHTKIVYAF